MPLKVILFGAPGSGKGTISECLVRDYGFYHISAGELLRREVEKRSPLGLRCAALMSAGELIPDELIIDLVCQVLKSPVVKDKPVLLDGFPRTLKQARELSNRGFNFDIMFYLRVDRDVLLERCLCRRQDPVTKKIYNILNDPPPPEIVDRLQIRSDDTREKHNRRMNIFFKQKEDLVRYFLDILMEVDANSSVKDVYKKIKAYIDWHIEQERLENYLDRDSHL
ncbi:unnamed protein product [Phytomonas sp. EM1]|nr:unnamed protein product [Phytomonas sp. EM1]|eukprot:CCW60005.1 unnamed protein product [Phytomonas sp. isolate EM1]